MEQISHPTILINILKYLDIDDIENAYDVCQLWRFTINEYKIGQKFILDMVPTLTRKSFYQNENFVQFISDENLKKLDGETLFQFSKNLKFYLSKEQKNKLFKNTKYNTKNQFCISYDFGKKIRYTVFDVKTKYHCRYLTSYKRLIYDLDQTIQPQIFCVVNFGFENFKNFERSVLLIKKLFRRLNSYKILIIPGHYFLARINNIQEGLLIYYMDDFLIFSIIDSTTNGNSFVKKINFPNLRLCSENKKLVTMASFYNRVIKIITKIFEKNLKFQNIDTKIFLIGFHKDNLLYENLRKKLPSYEFFNLLPIELSYWDMSWGKIENLFCHQEDQNQTDIELTGVLKFNHNQLFSCTIIDMFLGKITH